MTLVRYALERFRRMYLAEFTAAGYDKTSMVDYVVVHEVLEPGADDIHELINWYETQALRLRHASGIGTPPLPDECTCTENPECPLHGVPRATKHV